MFRLTTISLHAVGLLVLLAGHTLLRADPGQPKYEIDTEVFEIPGHGELRMEVPRLWNYNFTKSDEQTPPLITFYVLDENENEIFQLNMSVFWEDGYARNITRLDYIKNMVMEAGNNTLRYSDENLLELKDIIGTNGKGYYFELTDSSAGKDEYQYLTQGALGVGKVLLVFSLFSNDSDGVLGDAMFRSLKSARHSARRDV